VAKLGLPEIPPGNLRVLIEELHRLHARAGWPSTRTIARRQDFSHTSVHDLFTRPTPPAPKLPVLIAVVERLAETAPSTDSADMISRFGILWRSAYEEPFFSPPTEEQSQNAEEHPLARYRSSIQDIQPGNLRALMSELHLLHARAGWPSTRTIAQGQDFSHTAVHEVLTRTRSGAPKLPVLLGIVARLAASIPSAEVDAILDQFDRQWRRASESPFTSERINKIVYALRPEQIDDIRRTFSMLTPRLDDVLEYFYSILFARSPELSSMFPAQLEVQRGRFLRMFRHIVDHLDKPTELIPLLEQLGRDHRKFGVADRHFDVFGEAFVSAVGHFMDDAWTPTVEAAWNDAYELTSSVMRLKVNVVSHPASWAAKVVDHQRLGWDVARILVEPDQPIPYEAGEYVAVETPHHPRLWRHLSPANAPQPDGTLEFYIRAVEGGAVSPTIVTQTRRGDTWMMGTPMGRLRVDGRSGHRSLMVCGGTGIAPCKSLIEEIAGRDTRPDVTLFYGGRTAADLHCLESLRQASYDHQWLTVVPVTEDGSGPGAEKGTLADVVTRYGNWSDCEVIVSGSPSMERATISRMLVAGTPISQIRYGPFTID
jgi:NAD(P)H-flavin reductase/hemoglobin-like flavoprotein